MTFRKITFIFIAVLLSMLFLLQFWLIQNFTKDVSSKIGEGAFEVSRSTIETLLFRKPDIEFKSLAVSSQISEKEQIEIINSLSTISNEINIALHDGKKDKFLTINSAGNTYQVAIPRTGIDRSLEAMSNKITMSALLFIAIGLIAAAYFSRRLSNPLGELQNASNKVGQGEFGFQIKNNTQFQSIELRNTISAFNEMSNKIEKLQQENDKLQKQAKLAEISEITRGLAHTIRNPLNTLNLAIDELATVNNANTKKDLTRISKHQIQRIDKWVRSLMDMISSDSELVEQVNLENLINNCIEDISLNNRIKTNIKSFVQDKITANKLVLNAVKPELKSLIQSLISNAVEANEEAGTSEYEDAVTIDIDSITSQQYGRGVEVTLLDRGKGFNEDIKNKLFSPHNTNKTYGAGMGLYLAYQVATLKYNGTLTIEDRLDKKKQLSSGSKIVLTLYNRV